MRNLILTILMTEALLALSAAPLLSREPDRNASLDRKVRAFLEARSGKWHDMNVPASDGKLLYDIILRNNYRQALENFREAGLSEYIDARLGDVHELVPELFRCRDAEAESRRRRRFHQLQETLMNIR